MPKTLSALNLTAARYFSAQADRRSHDDQLCPPGTVQAPQLAGHPEAVEATHDRRSRPASGLVSGMLDRPARPVATRREQPQAAWSGLAARIGHEAAQRDADEMHGRTCAVSSQIVQVSGELCGEPGFRSATGTPPAAAARCAAAAARLRWHDPSCSPADDAMTSVGLAGVPLAAGHVPGAARRRCGARERERG